MNAREQILKAADNLFGEVGFDAATTREIAEKSGVNKALIHYHFKSKEALLEALLDSYYERLNRTLGKALEENGTMRERMTRLVDVYVDFLAKNLNFSRIVQRESSGTRHVDRIAKHLVPIFQTGTKLIEEAYPKTRTGELSAHQLFVSFYGMIVSYFTYSGVLGHLIQRDPLSKKELKLRKRHLMRMMDMVFDELGDEKREKRKVGRPKKAKRIIPRAT